MEGAGRADLPAGQLLQQYYDAQVRLGPENQGAVTLLCVLLPTHMHAPTHASCLDPVCLINLMVLMLKLLLGPGPGLHGASHVYRRIHADWA